MKYTLYYRNYLKSCNYSCWYCPFAKAEVNEKMLNRDKNYIRQFIDYISASPDTFDLFFAPRGEILGYEHYQAAIIELSALENVGQIVIQTNLSCNLDWLARVRADKLILWTTYHPGQAEADFFIRQVKTLATLGVRNTVGMVGVKENFAAIAEMDAALQQFGVAKPYFWLNAYKDKGSYYSPDEIELLTRYDPLFPINLKNYKSKALACRTGDTVFFVEWDGTVHRCWQEIKKLGNLYQNNLSELAATAPCRKNVCSCYIGYSNICSLELEKSYPASLLGRLP
ncbi:MAG: radical protein [Firmicutes bacterium]|nr:radical protein [Bacillota bacterium]